MKVHLIVPAESSTPPRVDDNKKNKRDGRWSLNAGSQMTTSIEGFNDDKPFDLVIDLKTCHFAGDKITAFSEHVKEMPIGYWDRLELSDEGFYGDLHFVKLENDEQKEIFKEVIKLSTLAASDVPLQVSVGADKGVWTKVKKGETVKLNGREYTAGERPLYILSKARIYEASVCIFGADSSTGRVAASQSTHPVEKKESTMSDLLKALLSKHAEKFHGLVARCVAEGKDESETEEAVNKAKMTEKDEEIAALKAKSTESTAKVTELAAKVTELEAKLSEKKTETTEEVEDETKVEAKGSTKGVTFASTDGKGNKTSVELQKDGVKTLHEAMVFLSKQPDTKDLKGIPLRRKARELFPNAIDG